MAKDLTVSNIDRQNILNNPYAVAEIQKSIGITGIEFNGKVVLLKEQVAAFFEVTLRTIENYLASNENELHQNGYEVFRGNSLKEFKLALSEQDVPETDFGNILKTPQLGILDFRAFLNLAMLIAESEKARVLRQVMLDIVLDTINKKTGGGTKYINQRDEDFLPSWFDEENYRKQFTDALKGYVSMGKAKYAIYTNKIYVSIFKEDAQEYRRILKLHEKDKVKETLYSEILDLVAAYEAGLAEEITLKAQSLNRQLSAFEVDAIFIAFEKKAHWKPLVEKARNKMASRDLAFRDAFHHQLTEYISPLKVDEFEKFIGEKSLELEQRLVEAKDVMKRLKERE